MRLPAAYRSVIAPDPSAHRGGGGGKASIRDRHAQIFRSIPAESTSAAARLAIQYAFFDWGIHQWAAFSIVGLIIAFYQFRKGERGLVSTVLRPLIVKLPAPRAIDDALDVLAVVAVVATVMGVATSLGLGILQVNGGLGFLYGVPESVPWQAAILGMMFVAYMTSASLGLDKGIKVLSNINLALAIGLMAFVLVAGPTVTILRTIVQGVGDYLQHFVEMSLRGAPRGRSLGRRVDRVLLGLGHRLVAVRRHVRRARFARAHDCRSR